MVVSATGSEDVNAPGPLQFHEETSKLADDEMADSGTAQVITLAAALARSGAGAVELTNPVDPVLLFI